MLEDWMSIWPAAATAPSLATEDGALISISILVSPLQLESLLEALARISFPINPQLYHDAKAISPQSDRQGEAASTTLVEFPAYAGRLEEVRAAVASYGFDPDSVQVSGFAEQSRRTEKALRSAGS